MTLLATIRRLTGASETDVSDDDVAAILVTHRVWHMDVPVRWVEGRATGFVRTYLRGDVCVWGSLEPCAEESPATGTTLVDGYGSPAVGWTLDEDGTVSFEEDQGGDMLFLSAYSYDVRGAAREVVAAMLATIARDYNVTVGDQRLDRSQAVAQLERLRDSLRPLPRVLSVARRDEVPSPRRRSRNRP